MVEFENTWFSQQTWSFSSTGQQKETSTSNPQNPCNNRWGFLIFIFTTK